MLKTAQYNTRSPPVPAVAYHIYDPNLCVFSGMDESCHGSTINWAEEIAVEIARLENRQVGSLRYFDLRTRTQYNGFSHHRAGDFTFDEVVLTLDSRKLSGIRVDVWRIAECPSRVVGDFSCFIDGEPRQIKFREWESVFR